MLKKTLRKRNWISKFKLFSYIWQLFEASIKNFGFLLWVSENEWRETKETKDREQFNSKVERKLNVSQTKEGQCAPVPADWKTETLESEPRFSERRILDVKYMKRLRYSNFWCSFFTLSICFEFFFVTFFRRGQISRTNLLSSFFFLSINEAGQLSLCVMCFIFLSPVTAKSGK